MQNNRFYAKAKRYSFLQLDKARVFNDTCSMKTKPPEKIEMEAVALEHVRGAHGVDTIKITHKPSSSEHIIEPKQLENWALRQLRAAIK